MKQSSKLLLTSLLTVNFANFAMKGDESSAPQMPENPMEAFKRDAKELSREDFRHLSIMAKSPLRLQKAFAKEPVIDWKLYKALIDNAENHRVLSSKNSPVLTLLKKYQLPCNAIETNEDEINPENTTCLNPSVISLFSAKFQALILKRKALLIEAKLNENEDFEKDQTMNEKHAFALGVFNCEYRALKEEFDSLQRTVTPFKAALKEVKSERPRAGDMDEFVKMMLLARLMGSGSRMQSGSRGQGGMDMAALLSGLMGSNGPRMQGGGAGDDSEPSFSFQFGCGDPNCKNCGGKKDSADKSE